MARRNLSDLLQNRFECSVPWETMSGEGAKRFCGQCQCHVFDLAQMEPRAVKARLEAHRGRLCARTIRENGRLKMSAAAATTEPRTRPQPERAPTLAAGVFGTWLALAAPLEATPAPPQALLVATLGDADEGTQKVPASAVQADPEQVAPESYSEEIDVNATLESYEGQATVGIVVSVEMNLRELFDDSELVVIAKVGASEVLAVEDGVAEVQTTLRLARRFKGDGWEKELTYRHSILAEAFEPGLLEFMPELVPGTLVLAFLSRVEGEVDLTKKSIYEATSYSGGPRSLTPEEAVGYAERLDELANLRRVAGSEAELDPAGLMEWLVATLEDPATRGELVGNEIRDALDTFEEEAEAYAEVLARDPESADNEAAALGASFTQDHRMRLSSALLATTTLRDGDIDLYRLVNHLDPETAGIWRIESLHRGIAPLNGDVHWWLSELAEAVDDEKVELFLESAEERLEAIDELYPAEGTPADEKAWEQERTKLAEQLVAELAALYEQHQK